MKNQLISFETAKLAKSKKFNIECNSYYSTHDDNGRKNLTLRIDDDLVGCCNFNNWIGAYVSNPDEKLYSAPTQSLLQKWLREVHKIHLVCWWYDKEDKFYTELGMRNKETIRVQTGDTTKLFDTYEEALEAGLQEALKLIK